MKPSYQYILASRGLKHRSRHRTMRSALEAIPALLLTAPWIHEPCRSAAHLVVIEIPYHDTDDYDGIVVLELRTGSLR